MQQDAHTILVANASTRPPTELGAHLKRWAPSATIVDIAVQTGELAAFLSANAPFEHGRIPDLVLLLTDNDNRLEDGVRSMRASSLFRGIPIVAITTAPSREIVLAAYAHGLNSLLRWPEEDARLGEFVRVLYSYWFDVCELPRHDIH